MMANTKNKTIKYDPFVSFQLPAPLLKRLNDHANQERRSRSQLIRFALENYLDDVDALTADSQVKQ